MDGIFISYRRDDASGYAGRLYDRLKAHFGDDRVFMDVAEIEPGTDFVEAIERAVGSCRVLIVLIGDEWLDIRDAQGQRRLDDPHDFIRLEVATALRRGIRVVPVVLDRASMPRAEELPEDLKPLARRQAIALQHQQWDASTAALIHVLQRLLGEASAGAGGWRSPRRAWAASALGVAAVGVGAWWFWPEAPRDEQEVGLLVAAGPGPAPAPSAGSGAAGVSPTAPVPPRPAEAVVAAAPVPTPQAATGGPERAPLAAAARPGARIGAAPDPAAGPPARATPAPPRPTPAPATAPAPAPAPPVAAATPTPALPPTVAPAPAPAARAADPRLPAVGQSWTYQVRGKWPTSPNRTVVVRVSQVNGEVVVDRLLDPAVAEPVQRRSQAGQGGFVSWPGIGTEFSPYLLPGEAEAWRGRGFVTPDVDGQWTHWHSEGKALGREAVQVPAGRFDAVKVEVWSSRASTGGVALLNVEPVRVHYLVWYAPEVKRYVRLQRRILSASGQEMERDVFELVSRQGG